MSMKDAVTVVVNQDEEEVSEVPCLEEGPRCVLFSLASELDI